MTGSKDALMPPLSMLHCSRPAFDYERYASDRMEMANPVRAATTFEPITLSPSVLFNTAKVVSSLRASRPCATSALLEGLRKMQSVLAEFPEKDDLNMALHYSRHPIIGSTVEVFTNETWAQGGTCLALLTETGREWSEGCGEEGGVAYATVSFEVKGGKNEVNSWALDLVRESVGQRVMDAKLTAIQGSLGLFHNVYSFPQANCGRNSIVSWVSRETDIPSSLGQLRDRVGFSLPHGCVVATDPAMAAFHVMVGRTMYVVAYETVVDICLADSEEDGSLHALLMNADAGRLRKRKHLTSVNKTSSSPCKSARSGRSNISLPASNEKQGSMVMDTDTHLDESAHHLAALPLTPPNTSAPPEPIKQPVKAANKAAKPPAAPKAKGGKTQTEKEEATLEKNRDKAKKAMNFLMGADPKPVVGGPVTPPIGLLAAEMDRRDVDESILAIRSSNAKIVRQLGEMSVMLEKINGRVSEQTVKEVITGATSHLASKADVELLRSEMKAVKEMTGQNAGQEMGQKVGKLSAEESEAAKAKKAARMKEHRDKVKATLASGALTVTMDNLNVWETIVVTKMKEMLAEKVPLPEWMTDKTFCALRQASAAAASDKWNPVNFSRISPLLMLFTSSAKLPKGDRDQEMIERDLKACGVGNITLWYSFR